MNKKKFAGIVAVVAAITGIVLVVKNYFFSEKKYLETDFNKL